jgi:hypothetical protein
VNERVLRSLKGLGENLIKAAERGLKRAALHLVARAKALAPKDTGNLQNSVNTDGRVDRTGDSMKVLVGATATGGKGAEHNYSAKVHENMQYDGPNVGGSRTQRRGPETLAKSTSSIEPTDGSAGGKFLERPLRNKSDQYTKIVLKSLKEAL